MMRKSVFILCPIIIAFGLTGTANATLILDQWGAGGEKNLDEIFNSQWQFCKG